MMGGTIVFSNIAGWLTKEWAGSNRKIVTHLVLGILIILAGIIIMGQGKA